ncbi:hypothetical protein NDU88_001381 [Pleurodeles waltl]|uniref:Uncharacterized protein n=1 Tax=Pleurodeles waltl TaxID=8319 RepID=A0AAV7WNF6_PLEWA|nr:hypothetical protein NDU88_001381 [Pleurodeles waltl]
MAGREAEYLQAAVALLEKAGRMDLLRQEALPALRPARKAAQGVTAAVMACSPPRSGGRTGQMRKGGQGGGRLSPGKQGCVVCRPAGPGRVPVFTLAPGRGGVKLQSRIRLGRGGRGASQRAVGLHNLGAKYKGSKQDEGRGGQAEGAGQGLQPRVGGDLSSVQLGEGYSGGGESRGQDERDGEYDPLIPVSSKWPTMLECSASESEGEQAEVGEDESGGASPPLTVRPHRKESLWETGEEGASSVDYGGGPRFFAARDFVFAGTPDLLGQRERREEGEPGERRAERSPWTEGQAEPRAAGRSPSPGWMAERRLATDTPGKRCGGRGRAPANAPPPGSGVRAQRGSRRGLEEGELVDDGAEGSWWEQGGVGPANALSQSLQATQDQTRARVRVCEEGHSGRRKAQERPPSLPAVRSAGGLKAGPSSMLPQPLRSSVAPPRSLGSQMARPFLLLATELASVLGPRFCFPQQDPVKAKSHVGLKEKINATAEMGQIAWISREQKLHHSEEDPLTSSGFQRLQVLSTAAGGGGNGEEDRTKILGPVKLLAAMVKS